MFKKFTFWLLFGIILLINIYSLKPILKSGYYFDDTHNSQTNAYLSYNKKSVLQFTKEISNGWIAHGRILPGVLYTYAPWVYLFNSLIKYKIFLMVLHLITVISFSFFISKICGSKNIFLLSFLTIPIFFQFRRSPDAVTSFGFLVPIILLKLSLSLIFLKKYLDKKKIIFFIVSLIFFLLMLLMFYEIAYIFFPIVIYLIYISKEKFTDKLKYSFPYIIMSLFFIGLYLLISSQAKNNTYGGSTINFDLRLIFSSFLKQVSAAIPLSYYFISKPQFFYINKLDYFYGFVLFVITFFLLSSITIKKLKSFYLYIFGALFIFLSTIPISLSKRYQLEVAWGIGYLPVYIAYFGSASILLGIILHIVNKLKIKIVKNIFIVFVSTFVGVTGFLNLQNNKLVIENLNSIFKNPRDLVEIFLKSSFISTIKENETIISLDEGHWDNPFFYFYITNKKYNVIGIDSYIETVKKNKKDNDLVVLKNVKEINLLKYFVVNKELNFAYLGKVNDLYYLNKDSNFFLVNNPVIFIKNNSIYKYVDFRTYSKIDSKKYIKNRVKLDELLLLEKKGDYHIYKIISNELVVFDSIKLINPSNGAELDYPINVDETEKAFNDGYIFIWKDGFSGQEAFNESRWRWSSSKNILHVLNLDAYPKILKMSMYLSSGFEKESTLNIFNGYSILIDSLKISIIPIKYERTFYVDPGVNLINFISDTQKIINANDPRDLRFKITDFSSEVVQ